MTLKETVEKLEENPLHGDEQKRYETLKEMQEKGIGDVPFVVITMLKHEAEDLLAGKPALFDHTVNDSITGKQNKRFQAFQKAFTDTFDTDARQEEWLAHYNKDSREAWVPHLYPAASENSIVKMIERESISRYAQIRLADMDWRSARKEHVFWPDFIESANLFSPTAGIRNAAWKTLPASYMLVVDGFSLFHPVIRDTLSASPINSWRNTGGALIFSVPEQAKSPASLAGILETELEQEIDKAFDRFHKYFDALYAFELTTERRVKRWLHVGAAELISRQSGAHRDNLAFFTPQVRHIAETIEQGGPR